MKYTKPQVLANAIEAAENAHESAQANEPRTMASTWAAVAMAWARIAGEMPFPPVLTTDQDQVDDGTVTLTVEEYRILRTLAAMKLTEYQAHRELMGDGVLEPLQVFVSTVNRLNDKHITITRPRDEEQGPWLVELSDTVE